MFFGVFWVLGSALGRLQASWVPPGAPRGVLGASWGGLGASWGRLGAYWVRLGASWNRRGRVLGRLGRSWGRLGVSCERLGADLRHVRCVFGGWWRTGKSKEKPLVLQCLRAS